MNIEEGLRQSVEVRWGRPDRLQRCDDEDQDEYGSTHVGPSRAMSALRGASGFGLARERLAV